MTAACLLSRRSDLVTTPFDETYWYGSEDWDLCLRLADVGKIVVDDRAVLFHHEFGTQDRYMTKEWLERRTRNHQWFNGLWGPALDAQAQDRGHRTRFVLVLPLVNRRRVCLVSEPQFAGTQPRKKAAGAGSSQRLGRERRGKAIL